MDVRVAVSPCFMNLVLSLAVARVRLLCSRLNGFCTGVRRNWIKKVMDVTVTAIVSATGSARRTANTLSEKKFGKIKIRGSGGLLYATVRESGKFLHFQVQGTSAGMTIWMPKFLLPPYRRAMPRQYMR